MYDAIGGAPGSVALTLFTDAFVVQGTTQTRQRRVSDVLNRAEDPFLVLSDVMFDEFRERRFAAPPTRRKMVAAGVYGKKSGRGFYDYSGEKPVSVNPGL